MRRGWGGEAKIFNFCNVARAYADVFGKDRVHILLFEDFVHNKDRFSAELAKVLHVDVGLIRGHLGEGHFNRTRREPGSIVIRKLDKKSFRYRLIRLLESLSLKAAADTLRVRIPAVSDAQKKAIFEAFKESNVEIAEEFGLDRQLMRDYGYF
jgi:hypothetical protein